MRIRPDYENTAWRKFERFVNGEPSYEIDERDKLETEMEIASTEDRERNEKIEEVLMDAEDIKSERHRKEIAALYHKYQNWPETKGLKIFQRGYRILAVVFCMAIISVLLYTVVYLPEFGNPNNPANSNEVVTTYIEEGMEATGAVNIVTGVILDYRAFDTLGESHVLFIAACCVLILLRIDKGKSGKLSKANQDEQDSDSKYEPKNDKILQKVSFLLVPPIIIYGIYVILNGHLSPGGGFSGGAIIGAGLILYLNAFGFEKTEKFFTYKTFSAVSFGSLIFYACAKSYSFFTGANHLNSHIPLGTPGDIISAGLILPLNIAVGLVVACTMYGFYALFRKGGM
ncbi:MAG: hypothetical protein E7256_12955 [Lachnospiraceae bacterium]|nr:hypothetical protein [Lachnospiraceae bacterium]